MMLDLHCSFLHLQKCILKLLFLAFCLSPWSTVSWKLPHLREPIWMHADTGYQHTTIIKAFTVRVSVCLVCPMTFGHENQHNTCSLSPTYLRSPTSLQHPRTAIRQPQQRAEEVPNRTQKGIYKRSKAVGSYRHSKNGRISWIAKGNFGWNASWE